MHRVVGRVRQNPRQIRHDRHDARLADWEVLFGVESERLTPQVHVLLIVGDSICRRRVHLRHGVSARRDDHRDRVRWIGIAV